MSKSPSDIAVERVQIELPLGEAPPDGYLTTHVDVQLKTVPQKATHRRLLVGLDALGARLADGRRVEHKADVLRWILEQVAEAVES